MAHTINFRLSRPLDAPELSRLWEGHINLFEAPELVFSVNGNEVTVEYPPQPSTEAPQKLRSALESALVAEYPDLQVEWQ